MPSYFAPPTSYLLPTLKLRQAGVIPTLNQRDKSCFLLTYNEENNFSLISLTCGQIEDELCIDIY